MKKLLVLAGLALFLFSCDFTNPDTTVVNNSDYPISFKYSTANKTIETLPKGTSTSTKYFYTGVIILSPEKRVTQTRDGGTITISNLPAWDVHVENKTDSSVTVSADGWMDEMTVPAGNVNNGGKIYTKNPAFTAQTETFPPDVQSEFKKNVFYVVIRD